MRSEKMDEKKRESHQGDDTVSSVALSSDTSFKKRSVKLGELWSSEARQDFSSILRAIPKPRKEKLKKYSLFDG